MRTVVKTSIRVLTVFLAASAFAAPAWAGTGPSPSTVPEIDPGAAAAALTLLVGGVLTLADRRRPT